MSSNQSRQHSGENILSQLWAKYFPYWPIFILLMVLAAGSAWFYLRHKLPMYEASATLLIKDEKKGTQDAKMVESIDLLTSKKIIENEIEVIKSRTLVGQVVKEMALYAPIYEVAKWKDRSAYTISPVKIEVEVPDALVEVARVDFRFNKSSGTVSFAGLTAKLNEWVSTPWGKLRFIQNSSINPAHLHLYFSLVNPKKSVQDLIGRIDATTAGKLSSVLNIRLKDEVPQRAEDILNGLIAAYDKASINEKNTLAVNTLAFLDERLRSVSSDLSSIEQNLQQYRAKKGAIDISEQGKLFLQNVSQNDQKLSDVNMKLSVLGQIEQSIFSDNHNGLVPTTLGFEEPVLTNLLTKLYDLGLQYEKIKKTTGEANPEAVALADQIQRLKPNILENIRSQKRSLEISKGNLSSTNNGYNSLLRALPQQERDLVEISRQQNIKSSIYSYLLQKKEEAALSHSSTVSDTRVIDKAESSLFPVGIGPNVIYCIAIVLGLALGVCLITIRELFNSKILYRQEIEEISAFPVIGEVAFLKSKSPLVIYEGVRSVVAEQFRLIRTSLPYLGISGRGKKILISSTVSGEGKSFISLNLAMSLAMAGKKVVLVEFDLRNPTLGSKLNMDTTKGVADYLSGNAELGDIIKQISGQENLVLIHAGNLPTNPAELILSAQTDILFQDLENIFDYIIVDSAPVGLVSDGYVLSRFCDATLFVVRHRRTPKRMLERLENDMKINKLKSMAIVFNGVRGRGFVRNDRYGYGYGYANSNNKNLK
ncbi:MAG: polysaccharide biosynthesis tyrosine autokinase [Sphingobacteriales bacterium]|nr:MAG: polysaccharide biosynthesis tyrosine autokinase [Sphingobacteriales bacterium]